MSEKENVSRTHIDKKETRKSLKKLTKTTKHHKARSGVRAVKYGAKNFARNIWLSLASTLVMTITLLILFVTVIASVVLSETATSMRDKIDITIFLKPQTSEETIKELSDSLLSDSNVKPESIVAKTSEEELELFLSENSDNAELIETLSDEDMKSIMKTTMQSTIRFKVTDPDNLDSIKAIIENDVLFTENLDPEKTPTYDMNKAEIEIISSWARAIKNGGVILSAAFLVISILIIFNTIRMAIFSRREEIYMMKLIGADRYFIRGPFLIEAQLSGVISGIIAATLGCLGFKLLSPTLVSYGIDITSISKILDSSWLVLIFAILISLGILIGSFSSRLAFKKYLRKL